MYTLVAIILDGCPYSIKAQNKLNDLKIKHKSSLIKQHEKDKYKTHEISTFPQIYLKKDNKSLLLGGYSDLEHILDLFYKQKYDDDKIKMYKNKYVEWNKHSVLRFIELINS